VLLLALALLFTSGCVTDGSARKLLGGLATGAVSRELLAPEVTLANDSGPVSGAEAVAAALANVKPAADAKVDAHHDVASVSLPDGGLVFAKSDGQGHVTTVLVFPASGEDPMPAAVEAYQQAWQGSYPYDKLEIAWSAKGLYQDPLVDARGRAEVGRMMADFHKSYSKLEMTTKSGVQVLAGRYFRFSWLLVMDGNQLNGFDVGFLGEDGKISLLSGFFSFR
jgi:hypothetical protein